MGSIDSNGSASGIKFKNNVFDIQFGEFSAYLREVNRNLEKAIEFSANKNESKMLQKYIEHFKSGNISTHKDSQREWIKDQQPTIETNLGWIEHYDDPEKLRAIWSGWVSIVNKKRTVQFQDLKQKG